MVKEIKSFYLNFKNIVKKISISRLIFSIIFSIAIFFMSKIVFLGFVDKENYMEKFYFSEYKILFLFVPLVYVLLYIIEKGYSKGISYITGSDNSKYIKRFCAITFIILLIVYLFYYFTFYPGGVYIDTWTSLEMITGKIELTSQQPVLYTVLLSIVKLFIPNYYIGFGILTIIQVILMVSIITYFIKWILNKGINPIIAFFMVLFFISFKLYPLYSVSVWKDTPFSLMLFLYTLSIIDMIQEFKNNCIKKSTIIKINVLTILIIFFRNNGIYLVLISFIALFLCFIKKIIKEKISNFRRLVISILATLILCVIVQHLLVYFGIKKSPKVEMLAIPLQQVSRVVAVDGNISNQQKELIEKVMPIDRIKNRYRALLADRIKWDNKFNEKYLYEHLPEYFKLWFELLLQNPSEYIISYLLETSGFWTFNVAGPEAYHSAVTWETLNEKVQNHNLIADNSNFDFWNNMLAIGYYSGGFFFWITALSALITFRLCEKKYLIGYVVPIALWLTVMVATPMGQALRYVYVLVLILPINIVYPAIFSKENLQKINEN